MEKKESWITFSIFAVLEIGGATSATERSVFHSSAKVDVRKVCRQLEGCKRKIVLRRFRFIFIEKGERKATCSTSEVEMYLLTIFSDISERNNDYSDTLDFRRG